MADVDRDIHDVGTAIKAMFDLGFEPVLVGGMALVTMGSQRVTKDFDFVIAHPGDRLQSLVDVFYARGFELVSRLNSSGEVTATIDNARVAAIRLKIDGPDSAFFFKPKTGPRVDLLFDFPVPAATLAEGATRIKIRSHVFSIASEADLLHLKKLAAADRSSARDAQDIEFLEARLKRA